MEVNDRSQINNSLSVYIEKGIVKFDDIFSIPLKDRINGLCLELGQMKVEVMMAAQISSAMSLISTKEPISGEMIVEISSMIIQECTEDNLAIEDLMIFLRGLITGKYGVIYNRMDVPTFFNMFEVYREERYQHGVTKRDENHVQNKSLGPSERECSQYDYDKSLERTSIGDLLKKYNKFPK